MLRLFFLLVMLFKIWQSHQPNTLYRISLAVFGIVLLSWLFVGGSYGEKLLWLYIFPACARFALGYQEGLRWNLGLYLERMRPISTPSPGWTPAMAD